MKKSEAVGSMRSFFRPHQRVVFDPHLVKAKTGECYLPERRVKQSFIAECDINNILKQYSVTGQLRHISARAQQGSYMDLPDDLDFQLSMNIVKEGEAAFATLPSKTRERFGNNPENFLAFMANPENAEEAIKMGLATKRPAEATKEPQAPKAPAEPPPAPEGSKQAPAVKN